MQTWIIKPLYFLFPRWGGQRTGLGGHVCHVATHSFRNVYRSNTSSLWLYVTPDHSRVSWHQLYSKKQICLLVVRAPNVFQCNENAQSHLGPVYFGLQDIWYAAKSPVLKVMWQEVAQVGLYVSAELQFLNQVLKKWNSSCCFFYFWWFCDCWEKYNFTISLCFLFILIMKERSNPLVFNTSCYHIYCTTISIFKHAPTAHRIFKTFNV